MDELQGDKVGREIVKANMKNKCTSYYLNGMKSNEILKTVLLKDMFAYCDAECACRRLYLYQSFDIEQPPMFPKQL